MKRTITTIATAIIMIASFSSFAGAATKLNPLKDAESAKIVITYLEAITDGNTDLNNFLFAEDFEYKNGNGHRFNKKKYIAFLQANKDLKYDCTTSYEILDQSGKACVAKATMKFDNFTRVDYITLNHSADGWKVHKVVTTYPQ